MMILTDKGWFNESDILTPVRKQLKKNLAVIPVPVTELKTKELRERSKWVHVKNGYYYLIPHSN